MGILKVTTRLAAAVLAIVGVAWLGTRVRMKGFELPTRKASEPDKVDPPAGLPGPVARYIEAAFGDQIPIIESASLIGSAKLTFNGISFPARFKFYHDAGKAYYHYIQLGWFGKPIITVNERYMDGVGILDLPGNRIENEEKVNAAGNLGLWAECVWLPSIFFTDPRVRWEAVNDVTAHLFVPNAAAEETFTVRFDPQTGLITDITTMRYQNPDSTERTLWTNRVIEWQRLNGVMIPALAETQWGYDTPWAVWRVEAALYNVDVSKRLAQFGGEYEDYAVAAASSSDEMKKYVTEAETSTDRLSDFHRTPEPSKFKE